VNLWQALIDDARDTATFMWESDRYVETTWRGHVQLAEQMAAGARARGVTPGTPVACLLTNGLPVSAALLGIWLAGGTVVSLPLPSRGLPVRTYLDQLRRLCTEAAAGLVLVERRFLEHLQPLSGAHVSLASYEDLPSGHPRLEPAPPGNDDIALVQYSSGSTGLPKGCLISTRAITRQVEALTEVLEIDPDRDRGVSWLPLSHDMALIGGLLVSWANGLSGVRATPERFLADPHTWLDDCAAFGATISGAPNFALRMATRAACHRPPSGGLRLRTLLVGAERVEWSTLTQAADALGQFGVTLEVMTPAYGLAEATLGVTMEQQATRPPVITVDSQALLAGDVRFAAPGGPGTTSVVSVGRPLPQTELEVLGDGTVGEIAVRSPSLARGYLNDSERTAACFKDGVLRTGDLGLVRDGRLYLIGRTDDLLTVRGRNIHARELEAALNGVEGVRPGCIAVVDVPADGGSRLVALAEPTTEHADLRQLARTLRALAASTAGVGVQDYVFVTRGSLPKTPSGKTQRFRCRQVAADEASETILERVQLSSRDT
jgi:acyl-CoA synthetase (AMP-forming)/AMP-acid ligase II